MVRDLMSNKYSIDLIVRKCLSIWLVAFLIFSNVLLITPASGTTIAGIVFTKNFDGVPINWVEINGAGTQCYAGLDNGSVIAMTANGTIIYNVIPSPGWGIKKMVSDDPGNIIWMDKSNNNVGYINVSGNKSAKITSVATIPVSDIDLAHNGSYWVRSNNDTTTSYLRYYDPLGTLIYSYNGVAGMYFTHMQYDNVNEEFFATNITNLNKSIFMFNISNYTGWIELNPSKLTKNSTLTTLDSFPYRIFMTIANAPTATTSVAFSPNYTDSTQCDIIRQSAQDFTYNETRCGRNFLWSNATPGGFTTDATISPQALFLNLSLYNTTSHVYNVTFNGTSGALDKNVSFYFGLPSYSNTIIPPASSYTNNGTVFYQNFTGSSTFTVPLNVTGVNVSLAGGGGGGSGGHKSDPGSGPCPTYFAGWVGRGGNAASTVSFPGISVTPGAQIQVVVGSGGSGGGYEGGAGGTGGLSSFNTIMNATGGTGGSGLGGTTGAAGNTSVPGYGSASAGLSGVQTYFSGSCHYCNNGICEVGTAGGSGFGAGGGGGGAGSETSLAGCGGHPGTGGSGASGYVQVSYVINDIPKYIVGAAPSSTVNTPRQNVTIDASINLVSSQTLMGNSTSLSVPKGGGIFTTGTTTITGTGGQVYAIPYTTTGMSTFFNATSSVGTSNMIASADSAIFYIEARSNEINIFQLDGTLDGNYKTGGIVNSVDIATANGLWATGGGNDGKLYIFSKAETSNWIVYFQGDTGTAINSVAITNTGDAVVAGRVDGTFEFVATQQDATTTNSYTAALFVNKGGSPYIGQNVLITESSGGAILSNKTGLTDTTGKFAFPATDGRQYLVNVNNGESVTTYSGSSQYPTYTVNIPLPILTRPYQYDSQFNGTTGVITSTYQDVNAANVNVQIMDVTTKTVLSSRDYIGVTSVNDVFDTGNPNGQYKTTFNFTRTTGARYVDTVYVSGSVFNRPATSSSAQDTLFIYAVYVLVLMVIALSIGAASIKYGVVMLTAVTFAGILFGFLPVSLYTVGIATSAFIAMLEVYRRHD